MIIIPNKKKVSLNGGVLRIIFVLLLKLLIFYLKRSMVVMWPLRLM